MTHFLLDWITVIDVLLIVAKGYSTEHKSEHHSHQAHKGELFDVNCYGLEYITNLWDVAEDVHQVQEEKGRMEKGAKESYTYV